MRKVRFFDVAMMVTTLFLPAVASVFGEDIKRVQDVATIQKRPIGAPKASDVTMRSLRPHPRHRKDPYDTLQAIKDFHATRLDWTYSLTKAFVKKINDYGCVCGGAASGHTFDRSQKEKLKQTSIRDLNGNPVLPSWMRKWKDHVQGCVNHPLYREGYLTEVKRNIDLGVSGMQRDNVRANYFVNQYGACFCDYCMKDFRAFLARETTPEQRQQLGIRDVSDFDYRQHLKRLNAPVGDDFGKWDGGELKQLFITFQSKQTAAFHRWVMKETDAYAGCHIPWSCNNGGYRFSERTEMFDYMVGELHVDHANPKDTYDAIQKARTLGKLQVLTLPKDKRYEERLPELEQQTRKLIAWTYACGSLMMVPWDMFMGSKPPRYFGKPETYADLYGFVRANAPLLDGYEEAAIIGKEFQETRYGSMPPVSLMGNSENVYGVVRAKPGQYQEPVVIHLMEWGDEAKEIHVRLRTKAFFGHNRLSVKLVVPIAYDKAIYDAAEQSKNYASLTKTIDLQVEHQQDFALVHVPPLIKPWGLLVVSPRAM